ncbi:MAG: 50S ribosomal protein L4 [Deltaproteobacteria bacterium CG12_big_fil_rev_8_21_14_0_65_43_10]|nr:MAG: 50S ribosomal protein L4 [Deltaproteobacteria bacterium CG2_30_43_15]PIQ45309.1 MAG: 50S ribosomal protein L4 [Deltaproteobacteria bacterium CG12_big_fil_rev_8_21_14_0_65_43_10]PIU85347.1 MAG: 50S ribosomal protein L4 [Deltaproteobacteria bacterium CG06_land_8_20_14_3_00_44_19]PIX26197.1 MAG: 50S ribosomal protein L4 [Deltaproteobacteria bacterium CG_4_8_14_3_um_filter_43_13]PIZ20349.1 MAG: 50S ribosomal protein L4 [Deltaproteobacteria bacterium CG_4_10_14_0_8_um_filter_43_12]PJB40332.
MPVLDVYDIEKRKISEINLNDDIFNVEIKPHLISDVAIMQQTNRRRGTASTKNRAMVRGGGVKPWRQKGTGRARVGSRRSPLWVGGGTVFGPTPKDYSYSLPKKVRREALKSVLTLKLKEDKITILDSFKLKEIKTNALIQTLRNLDIENVLIIDQDNLNLERSARNIQNAKVLPPEGLNVYDILKYENLILVMPSVEKIEARLSL